jgi:hypothetical protein
MFLCYQLQILFPLDHVGLRFIERRSAGQIRSPTWSGGGEVQPTPQLATKWHSTFWKKARDAKVLIPNKFYLHVLFPVSREQCPLTTCSLRGSSHMQRPVAVFISYIENINSACRWSSVKVHYSCWFEVWNPWTRDFYWIDKLTQTKSLWNYQKNGSKSSSVFFIPLILKPTESSITQKVAKEERRMPGSVHPFTASRSFALREWRGKENAAQLLTVMKSGDRIP